YIASKYNKDTGVFNRGAYITTNIEGKVASVEFDTKFASDVQPIIIMAYGKDDITTLLSGYNVTAKQLLDNTRARAEVVATYQRPDGENVTRALIDSNDNKDMGWLEWTGWLALGYEVIGESQTADYYLSNLKAMSYKGTLPYATEENKDTGFNSHTPFGKYSLSSVAAYEFARAGDNPFTLGEDKLRGVLQGYDLAAIKAAQATLLDSDYPVLIPEIKVPDADLELAATLEADRVVGKVVNDTAYAEYLRSEARKARAYQPILADTTAIFQQWREEGKVTEWGGWVPSVLPIPGDQITDKAEFVCISSDGYEIYKYTRIKSQLPFYFKVLRNPETGSIDETKVLMWLQSPAMGERYINALEGDGDWMPLPTDLPAPSDGLIVITEGNTTYYWQNGIKGDAKVHQALRGLGYVSLVPGEMSSAEKLPIWTIEEIVAGNLPLSIDLQNPGYGTLTVDGKERAVVYTPGLASIREHIAALEGKENALGGFVTGMDGKKVFISSVNATGKQGYIIGNVTFDLVNKTVTREVQYFAPVRTPQGTSFIPYGSTEINTYKDGLLIKQDKDGFTTEYQYDPEKEYTRFGVPSIAITKVIGKDILVSKATTTGVDPVTGTATKTLEFYGGAETLLIRTEINTYDSLGRLATQKVDNKLTENYYDDNGKFSQPYGIADRANTYVLNADGTKGDLFISSEVLQYEDGKALVKLFNYKTNAVWLEEHNGLGRISKIYYGDMDKGTFVPTSVEERIYDDGVIGLFNIASQSITYKCDQNGNYDDRIVLSSSEVLDENSHVILVDGPNNTRVMPAGKTINDILDDNKRLHYQGVEKYYQADTWDLVGTMDYQETREVKGVVIERALGHFNADNKLDNGRTEYQFYNSNGEFGRFDIADITITTMTVSGKESIFSYSRYTDIVEGNINYNLKQGLASFDGEINYANLEANKENIKFQYISKAQTEAKDNHGRVYIIKSDFPQINGETYYAEGIPAYITFEIYPKTGDARFATHAETYRYIKGLENYDDYKDVYEMVSHLDNLRVVNDASLNNVLFVYDIAKEQRPAKQSLRQVAIYANGALAFEVHEGFWLMGEPLKVYYNEYELPDHSNKIVRSWFGLGGIVSDQPRYKHYVVFIKGVPGAYWVFDRSAGDRDELFRVDL
ncbi:MAG: hypothetical protein PHF74_08125, partial [Dehalococcoidales bacterium]|nr:hypothetical protein [Dehalococcoidales bacterium]